MPQYIIEKELEILAMFTETLFTNPGTHYVNYAGINITKICLSLAPKCWDRSVLPRLTNCALTNE